MRHTTMDGIGRIAREHALLLEAIAVSPGPIAVYDEQDRLIAWNDAYRRIHAEAFAEHADAVARRALTYADLIRRTVEATVPPEQVEAHIAERLAAHRRGDGAAADRRYEGLGWFRVRKVRTPSGAVAGFAMEIDELVAKTEALEAARAAAEAVSAARARFLAAVSHELRTPLSGVMGLATLLETTPLDARQAAMVGAIRLAGQDLLAMLDDLLDDAKLANGAFALNPAPFSLSALVAEVAALFAGRAEAKGLALSARCAGDGRDALVGDAGRLRQVLGNLVSNAIKFTEAGGVRIEAETRPAPGGARVRLAVADDGPGVPAADVERLFADYAQLDAGRALGRGGTGLGLALSRRIVAAMGGALDLAASDGPGAVFVVTLTLSAARAV